MPGILFKVWSLTDRKMVIASTLQELMSKGKKKLSLNEDTDVRVYLEDGTEVDDDDILQSLESQTIIYLLQEYDTKPWETSRIIPIEEFDFSQLSRKAYDSPEIDMTSSIIQPETILTETPFDISLRLLRSWPKKFKVPVISFSPELNKELASGTLTWRCKSELLGHVSREIAKYTLKPSARQRDQVAIEIISLFPKLKSNIGEGHHGWAQKIYDKMNEESKRRIGPLRQKNNHSNIGKVKLVRLPRRGEINFTLEESVPSEVISASKQFLAEEGRKLVTERNYEAIAEHLNITFSHRRLLVSKNTLVKDIILDYPMFFSDQTLFHDFNLINGFNMECRFLEPLQLCAENIIEEGFVQKKRNTFIDGILQNQQNLNITALRLLPFVLKDKNANYFYEIYPLETDLNATKMSGPETPRVLVLGDVNDCLCYILVENQVVISVHGFVKSIMLMFSIYYCCNMQYPSECSRSLQFIQTYLLKLTDSSKLASKLITFCSKMP